MFITKIAQKDADLTSILRVLCEQDKSSDIEQQYIYMQNTGIPHPQLNRCVKTKNLNVLKTYKKH